MIDFHTHMFPEAMARATIGLLADTNQVTAFTDGTPDGLRQSTINAGIDVAIVLPVVTKPKQFNTINKFAMNFRDEHLLSFGGIHPDNENVKEKMQYLRDNGFKGIKLHPDYQQTYINDIKYKRIISLASEYGLIVSVHCGFDPSSPNKRHCSPKQILEMYEEVKPEKLVLAHMGSYRMWDDVEKYMVGMSACFDTGVVFRNINGNDGLPANISDEQFLRIVKNHGADKIVFASDSPWADQKEFVDHINGLPLSDKEKHMIFHSNAERLLGMKVPENNIILKGDRQNG